MTSHALRNCLTGSALVLASICLASPATAQCEAMTKVTGSWLANDGGTYSMRRINDDVWWIGDGPGWRNVFRGTLGPDRHTITGDWADVRGHDGYGTLTLKINGDLGKSINSIERVGSTGGGFAGTHWWHPCPE